MPVLHIGKLALSLACAGFVVAATATRPLGGEVRGPASGNALAQAVPAETPGDTLDQASSRGGRSCGPPRGPGFVAIGGPKSPSFGAALWNGARWVALWPERSVGQITRSKIEDAIALVRELCEFHGALAAHDPDGRARKVWIYQPAGHPER